MPVLLSRTQRWDGVTTIPTNGQTPTETIRGQSRAVLRVAEDLRAWLDGQVVPDSLLDDLATLERVGRWLAHSSPITATSVGVRIGASCTTPLEVETGADSNGMHQ